MRSTDNVLHSELNAAFRIALQLYPHFAVEYSLLFAHLTSREMNLTVDRLDYATLPRSLQMWTYGTISESTSAVYIAQTVGDEN